MSLVDRKSPTRVQPVNGNFQYEQDIKPKTLDVWVDSRQSEKSYLGSVSRSGFERILAVPGTPLTYCCHGWRGLEPATFGHLQLVNNKKTDIERANQMRVFLRQLD